MTTKNLIRAAAVSVALVTFGCATERHPHPPMFCSQGALVLEGGLTPGLVCIPIDEVHAVPAPERAPAEKPGA